MQIIGIGTDIIEVARIEKDIEEYGSRFLDRVFTQKEQDYCNRHKKYGQHFAGRFAAKEAVAKALGTGFSRGIGWKDIEILNNDDGQPLILLSEDLQQAFPGLHIFLSISHCQTYATAMVVITRKGNTT